MYLSSRTRLQAQSGSRIKGSEPPLLQQLPLQRATRSFRRQFRITPGSTLKHEAETRCSPGGSFRSWSLRRKSTVYQCAEAFRAPCEILDLSVAVTMPALLIHVRLHAAIDPLPVAAQGKAGKGCLAQSKLPAASMTGTCCVYTPWTWPGSLPASTPELP